MLSVLPLSRRVFCFQDGLQPDVILEGCKNKAEIQWYIISQSFSAARVWGYTSDLSNYLLNQCVDKERTDWLGEPLAIRNVRWGLFSVTRGNREQLRKAWHQREKNEIMERLRRGIETSNENVSQKLTMFANLTVYSQENECWVLITEKDVASPSSFFWAAHWSLGKWGHIICIKVNA